MHYTLVSLHLQGFFVLFFHDHSGGSYPSKPCEVAGHSFDLIGRDAGHDDVATPRIVDGVTDLFHVYIIPLLGGVCKPFLEFLYIGYPMLIEFVLITGV